ncbi:MAG: MFS transporter [Proteobacteria bacterium]|nr:MFS transporter [Pseudomonadota bacterium]
MVSLYLMKFATDELRISLAAMGVIFAIPGIWDALTDPMAGYFSGRTRLKSGGRRPWMLASILPISTSFYMMWNSPLGLDGHADRKICEALDQNAPMLRQAGS